MNYYLYCLRRFARLILLLWIVFRIAPLAAQDRAARLDFQVRKATLDTFVRQLEDSTGFSFIYGEKVQLRQPVTLDVRQKTIEEILQYAFGQEAITFKISGTHILLGERPVSRKYTVSGYITDSISSETLIGANILESSCHTGTSTNPFGFYSLTLPEGETGLFFSYLGYETKHCRFLLSRDTVMNIRLQTNNQLSEIIVLSDKKETGIRATGMGTLDIPMTQIKNTPAILGEADILKTIQLMPGVQAGTEGFSGLYVRGGGPDQNLILLDGIPIYNADHMLGVFSIFTPEAMKKVTLFKGSFPARYGGRLSSIVDIRTNDGDMQNYHGTVSIGLLTSKLHLEGPILKDRTSFCLTGRRTYLDLVARPFLPEDKKYNYYFYDINAKVNHKFSDRSRLFLSFYKGKDHYDYKQDKEYDGYSNNYGASMYFYNSRIDFNWGNTIAAGRWNYVFNSKLFSNTTVAYNHYQMSMADAYVEALSMLEDAISGFSAAINPITIQTMAMLVGDESLQFRFVNSKTNPSEIIPDFKYNQQTKVFTVPAGILQHMTLGVSKLSSSHAASEYKYWDMQAYVSPPLDETDAMYLYSRCSKSGTTGTFILSKTPCKMDSGDGYYYFLTGALSSEYESERSFVTVYGFTEILPGRITVGMIVSPDGQTYFNVAQGEFCGKFVFKSASGYENIADKPDLSVYGTKALLNSIKDNLQNQLDGKIDTYYQSSNPWNNWPAGTEPEHVGDMWYNTSTGLLQTYIGPSNNIWREIVDPAAVDAAKAAAKAADVKADGKRRVFLSTPYPPYDAGDQWIEYGGSGSMRICVQGRQSGRYVSSAWQISSADGNTQASIDRGVISAVGFLTFGGSAGVVGSGDIRIWSGGSNAAGATFKVKANGDVESKGNIYIANINNEKLAGFSGAGTTGDSIRIWAGNASPGSAAFRVTQDGTANISKLNATGGKIGRFEIVNNRLVWDQYGYMGGISRALKMGYSTGNEGVLDVVFDAATEGKFGVKAVGRAPGSAAIYGSSKSAQSYPDGGSVWAGWFDGYVFSDGYFTRSPKGKVRGGLKGAYRIDNSDTWFVFDNGIAVACTKPRAIDLNTDNF